MPLLRNVLGSGGNGTSGYSGYSGWSGYSGLGSSGFSGYSGWSGNYSPDAQWYTFNSATSPIDATPGTVQFDSATFTSVTEVAVSAVNFGGTNVVAWLDAVTLGATITISDAADASKFVTYTITDWGIYVVNSHVQEQYTVTYLAGSVTSFSNGRPLLVGLNVRGVDGTNGISGYSGQVGTSGYSGWSGISGFSGYSGPAGTSGFSGYSGPAGTSGFSGYSGISGRSGYSGYSGPVGTSGFSGYSGWSGISGFSGAGAGLANPTATIGLTAVNGVAATGLRSDAAQALSQAIVPTWTGLHTFSPTLTNSSATGLVVSLAPTMSTTSTGGWTALKVNPTQSSDLGSGTKLLADFQLGGTSKASLDSSGNLIAVGSLTLGTQNGITGGPVLSVQGGADKNQMVIGQDIPNSGYYTIGRSASDGLLYIQGHQSGFDGMVWVNTSNTAVFKVEAGSKRITASVAFIETPVSLSVSAGHVATDASLGNLFDVAASANFTLDNPTNPVNGQKVTWRITQDATGSRTISFGTAFDLGGQTITLSTGANKVDYVAAIYRSAASKWDVLNPALGY